MHTIFEIMSKAVNNSEVAENDEDEHLEPSGELFADEEELIEEEIAEENAEFEGKRPQEGEDEGENVFEEDLDDGERLITLPIKPLNPPPGEGEDIWLIGLPMSVQIEEEPFDEQEWAHQERQAALQRSIPVMREIKQALNSGFIRHKVLKGGQRVSNTKWVEFSDGSCALLIGRSVFEADSQSLQGRQILLEVSQQPLLCVHGLITQRRIMKPADVAALQHRINVKAKGTRVTTVREGADAETRLKRQMEAMAHKEVEREKKRKTTVSSHTHTHIHYIHVQHYTHMDADVCVCASTHTYHAHMLACRSWMHHF